MKMDLWCLEIKISSEFTSTLILWLSKIVASEINEWNGYCSVVEAALITDGSLVEVELQITVTVQSLPKRNKMIRVVVDAIELWCSS